LIDDLIWKRSFDDGKTFVDWKGYTNWKLLVEEDVDVFKTTCIDGKEIIDEKNGTSYFEQDCTTSKTGTEKQWNVLDFKKEYKAGTYNYRVEGSKKASVTYDWIIKTNGELLTNWAVWGAVIGVGGVEASITINSPANNSIQYTKSVTTNATANVTNGASLVNASLNLSVNGRAWEIKNTTILEEIQNTESIGITLDTLSALITGKSGYKIRVENEIQITNVTRYTGTTATTAYIQTAYGSGVLATATFSGNTATFSSPVTLQPNTDYYILADSGVSNYQYMYKLSTSLPVDSGKINWNVRIDQVGGESTTIANTFASAGVITGNKVNATVTFTNTFNAGDVVDFNYKFCDTDGDCGKSETRRFTIDGTAPTIALNYPTALIDYAKLNGTLQLNFTAIDTNLDKVWYNYNGTNITIAGAVSGVYNISNITLTTKKNITIYANDTAGNLKAEVFSWDYTLFETSRSFNSTTFTTAEEPFTLNITTDGSQIPIAYLVYNGTSYLATRTGNLTNPMFSNSITMTNAGNMSFYWSILWGSQVINTSTSYQQVTAVTAMNITSSACSAGLTKVANFTFANEVNFTALTGATVNYNFKYGIANSTGLFSAGTLTNVSVFNVCLNLTQSANYTIGYGEVQYSNDGYSDRRFYLFENTRYSNNTITNVLYSLPNANSYSFLFEARTPALNVYSDKYVSLLRWYPNINDYKIVEMGKTDQKGQTVFKVKTEDVDYRIGIYERDGTLIYLANPIRMVCLVSPCSYTLTVRTTEGYSYDNRLQVQNELTYNNGTFTFTYNDPSQATDLMRLVVYSMSGTDETQICEDNSTSFTAILSCDVSSTTGVLKAVAYRTASPEFPLATLIIDTLTTIFQGTFGLFLQFLLTTTLILAGLISPVVAIILGILSLLIGVLVFKTISISIAIGIGILGAIVIHFIKRQGTI
jgi:hypothetical protein